MKKFISAICVIALMMPSTLSAFADAGTADNLSGQQAVVVDVADWFVASQAILDNLHLHPLPYCVFLPVFLLLFYPKRRIFPLVIVRRGSAAPFCTNVQ